MVVTPSEQTQEDPDILLEQEFSILCKQALLNLRQIKTVIEQLETHTTPQTVVSPSVVATALVSVFTNRRKYEKVSQFEALLEVVEFLIKKQPKSMQEIIVLETKQKKSSAQAGASKLRYKSNGKTLPSQYMSKNRTDHMNGIYKNFSTRSLNSQVTKTTLGGKSVVSTTAGYPDFQPRTSFDVSKIYRETQNSAQRLSHAKKTGTTYDPDDPNGKPATKEKRQNPGLVHGSGENTVKFFFTPVYSFLENLPNSTRFNKADASKVAEIEYELFKILCLEIDESPASIVVAIQQFKGGETSPYYSVYEPLWKRLLSKGKLAECGALIERNLVHVSGKTTHFKGQALLRSSTALHEICMWSKKKLTSLHISSKEQLDFVNLLIDNGADPNDPYFSKESKANLAKIQNLKLTKYDDKLKELKKLPKALTPYNMKTALSIAIMMRNLPLVQLLAKRGSNKDFGEIIFPRKKALFLSYENQEIDDLRANSSRFHKVQENEGSHEFRLAADEEVIPVVYSLKSLYYHTKHLDRKFADFTLHLENRVLFNRFFER